MHRADGYYTFAEEKEKFHADCCCSYNVKAVLPYDRNRISCFNNVVAKEAIVDEPDASDADRMGHKLLALRRAQSPRTYQGHWADADSPQQASGNRAQWHGSCREIDRYHEQEPITTF